MSDLQCCIACHGEIKYFGSRNPYKYFRCIKCSSLVLSPLPTSSSLAEAYQKDYSNAGHFEGDPEISRDLSKPYYKAIVDSLKSLQISSGVVDCGAGWGGLCQEMISSGILCSGIEISEEMLSYCKFKNLPVIKGNILELGELGQINAFTLCAVFEHLSEPDKWLTQARNLLPENGVIVSLQPTAVLPIFLWKLIRIGNWVVNFPMLKPVFSPPWHVGLYTIEGMRQLASRNGFFLEQVIPGPQGTGGKITSLIRKIMFPIHSVGRKFFGNGWPLCTSHIFVLRSVANTIQSHPIVNDLD